MFLPKRSEIKTTIKKIRFAIIQKIILDSLDENRVISKVTDIAINKFNRCCPLKVIGAPLITP